MIDINRVVDFATSQGYYISDLYKTIGMKKAGFLNIRRNNNQQFRIDYFYKICDYLCINPHEGLQIFDSESKVDLKEYKPNYHYKKDLKNREIKIEDLIKFAHSKGIYIKDIVKDLNISNSDFKKMRYEKSQKDLKEYFFRICEYISIPYGKAIDKYTVIKNK